MTLHNAIERILIDFGRAMTASEITRAIAERNLYERNDGETLSASQVIARVNNYPEIFDKIGDRIALRNRPTDLLLNILYNISDRLRSRAIYNLDLVLGYLLFYFRISRTDLGEEYFGKFKFDRQFDYYRGYTDHLNRRVFDSVNKFVEHVDFADLNEELLSTFKKLPENSLIEIVGELQYFDFDDVVMGDKEYADTFNNFLNSFSGWGREVGESFTPINISKFISSIVHVSPNENLCDPFAGNAGLVSEVLKGHGGYGCVLQDINPVSVLLGRMNLILHGLNRFRFSLGNSVDIYSTLLGDRKFDYVITHPPFGIRYSREDFYKLPIDFLPANSRGEIVHLQIAIYLLNETGKAIVLMPDGFLFTNDRSSKEIKSLLLHNDWIEAVYSLPGGSLKPYSSVNTSLLVINKNKAPHQHRRILFKEVSEYDLESAHFYNHEMLFDSYSSYSIHDNRSRIVDLDEVYENDLLLNVNRYLNRIELGHEYQSVETVLHHYAVGVGIPKKHLSLSEGVPYITIKDLSNSEGDPLLPQDGINTFISKASSIKSNPVVRSGAVLIAKVGTKLKPTLFIGHEAAFSSNIIALYPDENLVISEYLIHQFNEPYFQQQLNQIRGGAVQVFVRLEDFLRLKIKVPSLEIQEKELLQIFRLREQSIKSLKDGREQDEKSAQRTLFSAIKHEFSNLQVVLSGGMSSLKLYLETKVQSGDLSWNDKIVNIPDARTIREVVNQQESVLQEMGSLFDDVQVLLALDRSKLKKERVVLKSFIHDQVEQMKGQLKDVKVLVGLTGQAKKDRLVVDIDKLLFAKVLKNFINNTLKHGFQESTFDQRMIIFHVALSEDELWLELYMMNNGNKFPEGFTFDDFISFGVKTGVNRGAGIGGFLINEVVKFHDGTLEDLQFPDGAVLYVPTEQSEVNSKDNLASLSKAFIPGVGFKIKLPYNS